MFSRLASRRSVINSALRLQRQLRTTSQLPINYGVRVVPQQQAWIVERLGKFGRVLESGLHFLIPIVDKIAYVHSLKEEAIPIPNQTAITADNVAIAVDGVVYLRVNDPVKASYGVDDYYFATTQLAMTTMRSELGKMTLDKTFAEREALNISIVEQINKATHDWGVECLRYEIRDITPPAGVRQAMDMQAEAERKKRATILDSEGQRQSEINVAEGARQSLILQAEGEARATITKARATADSVRVIAEAIRKHGGSEAVSLRIAEQYIKAFSHLAKSTNTMLLPTNAGDPTAMIAQALSIYKNVVKPEGGNTESSTQYMDKHSKSEGSQGFDQSSNFPPGLDLFNDAGLTSSSHDKRQ